LHVLIEPIVRALDKKIDGGILHIAGAERFVSQMSRRAVLPPPGRAPMPDRAGELRASPTSIAPLGLVSVEKTSKVPAPYPARPRKKAGFFFKHTSSLLSLIPI